MPAGGAAPAAADGHSSTLAAGQGSDFGQESSVVVDMGDPEEVRKIKKELELTRVDFEELQANYDREVADGKRMRAETTTLRDRIEELRRSVADRDEQVTAHNRVAEELRQELNQTKDELANTRGEVAEMGEDIHARERQLERAQNDVAKLKEEIEDLKRQVGEVSKTKDEGWRKLNEQLAEIEHLREVINEQERMLEERRVGLVSQEEVIKELRIDKEKRIKEVAQLKAERDELNINDGRRAAQLSAIDEENRRLSQMLVESQGQASGSSAGTADHTLRLTGELKDLRVSLKKLESDRDRMQESYDRSNHDVEGLEAQVANLEVELRDATNARIAAESGKAVAEEAMAKAELARHKAAEEALEAAQSRDSIETSSADTRRELDKFRRQVAKLEEEQAAGGGGDDSERMAAEAEGLRKKAKLAQDKAAEFERSIKTLSAEVEAAKQDAKHARAEAEAAALLGGDVAEVSSGGDMEEIAAKANEVYGGINDLLSELRNNLMLIQGEFGEYSKEDTGDSARMISDTIETLVGNAEDAKGILRGLRELLI